MAKWVEALGAKPDDPSSIPWTYMVEGKISSYKLSLLRLVKAEH